VISSVVALDGRQRHSVKRELRVECNVMSSETKRSMLSDKRGSAPALWTDRPRNVSVSAAERRSINGMKWSDPETTCSIRRSLAVSPINYVTLEMRSLDKCHKADNPPAHARYSYAIIF